MLTSIDKVCGSKAEGQLHNYGKLFPTEFEFKSLEQKTNVNVVKLR